MRLRSRTLIPCSGPMHPHYGLKRTKNMNTGRLLISVILAGASGHALASGVTAADLEEVVVTAGRIVLAGAPRAASEGTVFHEQLENRPLLRTGEILELVPGLVVT